MPRYHFHFASRGGEQVPDAEGVELDDLRAAHRHAVKLIRRTVGAGGPPARLGLVDSISRPGGNLTGFLQTRQPLTGNRLDLLGELLGRHPRRVAYVLNPVNMNAARLEADAAQAAGHIGADLRRVQVSAPSELERSFDDMHYFSAVIVQHDFMFVGLRKEFAALARRRRIPVMYENCDHVEAGGLISYGADPREGYRQGAVYVDRILRVHTQVTFQWWRQADLSLF